MIPLMTLSGHCAQGARLVAAQQNGPGYSDALAEGSESFVWWSPASSAGPFFAVAPGFFFFDPVAVAGGASLSVLAVSEVALAASAAGLSAVLTAAGAPSSDLVSAPSHGSATGLVS